MSSAVVTRTCHVSVCGGRPFGKEVGRCRTEGGDAWAGCC